MNHVRNLMLICLAAMIIAVGCISLTAPQNSTPATQNQTCHTATIQTPVTSEHCDNITLTKQVCGKRKLNYSVSYSPRLDLCISDGGCTGKPISNCTSPCTQIMSRCMMTVENLDTTKAGTWIVGATFTVQNAGFVKEPIVQTIEPGQSGTFDFYQIYSGATGTVNSATCNLTVTSEPIVDDCHDEASTRQDCQNVTNYETTQQQVCQ